MKLFDSSHRAASRRKMRIAFEESLDYTLLELQNSSDARTIYNIILYAGSAAAIFWREVLKMRENVRRPTRRSNLIKKTFDE